MVLRMKSFALVLSIMDKISFYVQLSRLGVAETTRSHSLNTKTCIVGHNPSGYTYSIEKEVLFIKLFDVVSIDSVEEMLTELDQDPSFLKAKIGASLVDLRGAKTLLTMPNDYSIFSERDKKLKSTGIISPEAKTAIVVSKLTHEWAIKLLTLVARRQGSDYQSFRRLDQACEWIEIDDSVVPEFISEDVDKFEE